MRATLLFLCLSAPAFAGWVLNGNLTQGGTPGPLKQYYQGDNARLEFRAAPGSQQDNWLVYRGGTGMISVVDSVKKSYLEMHEKDVERIGGLISVFPGAHRSPAPKVQPGDISFKKDVGKHTVGKWKCTRYAIHNKGKKTGSLCVVPFESVGASPADLKPLASLARTFSSLGAIAPQQSSFLGWGIGEAIKLGLMVEAVGLDAAGKPASRLVLDSVKKEELADATFANPEGFTRNDLTSLLQGMMMKGKMPSGK